MLLHLPISLSTVSHFFTPSSQQHYLKRAVCLLAYTPSLSLHPLALSSWASVFSALPRWLLLRSLMTSVLWETVVTCPFLCYLMSKQHLTRLTASSSLSLYHSFLYPHTVAAVEVSPQGSLHERMFQDDSWVTASSSYALRPVTVGTKPRLPERSQPISEHEGATRTGTVSLHEVLLLLWIRKSPLARPSPLLNWTVTRSSSCLLPSSSRFIDVRPTKGLKLSSPPPHPISFVCFICLVPSWCRLPRGSTWTHTLSCSLTHLAVPCLFASSFPRALNTGGFLFGRTLLFLVSWDLIHPHGFKYNLCIVGCQVFIPALMSKLISICIFYIIYIIR